jgi:hypothetical protein
LVLWCLIPLSTIFSVILWRSVLLVEETGENHWPVASHWQTQSHNVVHLAMSGIRTNNISGDRYRLHIGGYKSNYHTITTTIAPTLFVNWFFSSHDPERPSSVRPLTFHILINSSEVTGPIWTKLWWYGPWMAPFQNCVRWSRLPTKMATKLKIEKRGDEILIVHCCFSMSKWAQILTAARWQGVV